MKLSILVHGVSSPPAVIGATELYPIIIGQQKVMILATRGTFTSSAPTSAAAVAATTTTLCVSSPAF